MSPDKVSEGGAFAVKHLPAAMCLVTAPKSINFPNHITW